MSVAVALEFIIKFRTRLSLYGTINMFVKYISCSMTDLHTILFVSQVS